MSTTEAKNIFFELQASNKNEQFQDRIVNKTLKRNCITWPLSDRHGKDNTYFFFEVCFC